MRIPMRVDNLIISEDPIKDTKRIGSKRIVQTINITAKHPVFSYSL